MAKLSLVRCIMANNIATIGIAISKHMVGIPGCFKPIIFVSQINIFVNFRKKDTKTSRLITKAKIAFALSVFTR